MRWIQLRGQILQGDKPNGRHANALRRADEQLREVRHIFQLISRVDPHASDPDDQDVRDRRHVAAMPAEAVISRSMGAEILSSSRVMVTNILLAGTQRHYR